MKMTIDGGLLLDLLKASEAVVEGEPKECLMELHDDRWVMKVKDASDVLMFACRVGREAMEEYTKTTRDEIGFDIQKVQDAIGTRTEPVTLEVIEKKGTVPLSVRQQGFDARIGLVNTDYVEAATDKVPNIDYAVSATGDLSWLTGFVNRADKLIGGESYIISPRQGMLYLYAGADTDSMSLSYHWDDFDDYSIDWSKGFQHDNYGVDPETEQGVDALFSIDWTKAMEMVSDEGTVFIDNHAPLKILFDLGDGVDASYFISPRIPTGDSIETLPEDVKKERGLETTA